MAKATIVYFRQANGRVPLLDWLRDPRYHNKESKAMCVSMMRNLAVSCRARLRHPSVKHLRGDIYELRVRYDTICYRILFSFEKGNIIFLTHGFVKQTDKTPPREITKAIKYLNNYRQNKTLHGQMGDEDVWEKENS